MAKKPYLPANDDGKVIWLLNFANKLPTYALKYGITPAEVADITASEEYTSYWFLYLKQFAEYLVKVTAFKNELFNGVPAGVTAALEPVPPTAGAPPPAVEPGVFGRATSIGNRVKKHKNYVISDGQDMGLEGPLITVDLVNIKPVLKMTLVAGRPRAGWKKQGMSALEIHVMRDNVSYVFLAIDTTPDYEDTFALPAAGQSAVWKYKGIYLLKDVRVGQWSDEVSVTVRG